MFIHSLDTLWYFVRNLGATWFILFQVSVPVFVGLTNVAKEHLKVNLIHQKSNTVPLISPQTVLK